MKSPRKVPAPPRSLALGLGAALLAAAAGCGGGGGPAKIDAGPLYSCATEARAVPYAPNLTRTSESGSYSARLLLADPAPPAKNNNTWTIEILDASSAPVAGLVITPSALMIDHGHSPPVKPVAMPAGDGTSYTITPLYLFMAGFWEVTLSFQPAGGAKETVVFPICIPG